MKGIFPLSAIPVFLLLACNTKKSPIEAVKPAPPIIETVDPPDAPSKTWKEHWFEHVQLLNRVHYYTSVVVYYDGDVKPTVVWPKTYMAEAWNYTKKAYGKFGDDSRLFVIYHAGNMGVAIQGLILMQGMITAM